MKTAARPRSMAFKVIGQNSVKNAWDGSPLTLNPADSATMPQTPDGSMVFAYTNISTVNHMGTLALVSGGSAPTFLTALPFLNQPSMLVNNWQGQNLTVTNVSAPSSDTPIEIAAYAPGMPGQACVALQSDGAPVALAPMQCAQGSTSPGYMQMMFEETSGTLAVFVLLGGPTDGSGNNAYMIAVNSTANTGPGTGQPPPPGYYATTTAFSYGFSFNWGVTTVYVANMSPTTAPAGRVSLRQL
jgi:hypothetical protein